MKKVLILAFMAAYLPVSVWAQWTISGKITEANSGTTLVGATVLLPDLNITVPTDANGNYAIKNLKTGSYTLKVSFVGYASQEKTIDLKQNTTLNFELSTGSVLSDAVIVSATRVNANAATSYRNVDKTELKKNNLGVDLPYLLNQTPSVVVSSDAGNGVGYTGIRIRGSDATRINLTINGIPFNDSESQGTFLVNLPDFASSIENIQIQRGVGSSTNGAGAFGASINIQTNQKNEKAYAELANSAGSFNTFKNTLKVGSGLIDGKFTFDGRLSKIDSEGYIDRAFSDLRSFYLSGAYYGNKSIIRANVFSGAERTYLAYDGVPENLLESNRTFNSFTYKDATDNYQQDHFQLFYATQPNNKWLLNTGLHYTKGKGFFELFQENVRFSRYNLPNVTIGNETFTRTDLVERRWLDNDFYGITYSVQYQANATTTLTLGGAYNEYLGQHYGEIIFAEIAQNIPKDFRYYDNDAEKTDFNVFVKGNVALANRLEAFADVQYRSINYSFFGFTEVRVNTQQAVQLQFFNPKAGLTYQINPLENLYASVAVANKEPNRREFTRSTPDSRPRPERLINYELGYRKQVSNYRLGANLYYMDYKDQLVLTGQINDVGAFIRSNIAKSYRVGLELDGSVRITSSLAWAANLALSQNKVLDFVEFIDDFDTGKQIQNRYSKTDIAYSPNFVAGSELEYSPTRNLNVALVSKLVGKQFLDNTSNQARIIESFFTNSVRANYKLPIKGIREMGLTFMFNNIFNEKYEDNGYTFSYVTGGEFITENYYYPQAGFNFMAGLSLKF